MQNSILLNIIVFIAGGSLSYLILSQKLKSFNVLKNMSYKKSVGFDVNIGRSQADNFVKNYQDITQLPVKALRFPAQELSSMLNPTGGASQPDELIIYFGKKSKDASRKGDFTIIVAGVKENTQLDDYYADQASPCPQDCPQNSIGY